MQNPSWYEDPPEDPPEDECMCGRGDGCDCDITYEKAQADEEDFHRDCDYWNNLK